MHVLDSTDPAQVKAFEHAVNLERTLFIVSSKSGSTLEPNIFKQYFFERTRQILGPEKAGSRWVAVTDPGSKLEKEAQSDKFRYIFHGVPTIPMLIYTSVDLPIQQAVARTWGAALMLTLIILIANIGARVMLARTHAKMAT